METWNLRKLASKDSLSDLEYIQWLQELGLITTEYECGKCHEGMKLRKKKAVTDGFVWGCSKCKGSKSVRAGSWFEGCKLSLRNVMLMTYMWATEFPQKIIRRETGFATHTVCDWFNFCREAATKIVEEVDFEAIGGPGKIVQIDESLVGKRKYNKGKKKKCHQWVFGGVEEDSNKCFLVKVANRDARTLVPLIEKYVVAGTTIYSDCWKAYSSLGRRGYKHLTVNHKVTFKDGDVCTNKVEGMWKHVKQQFPLCNRQKSLFDSYLGEFMFRKKYCDEDIFNAFISRVKLVYVPLIKDPVPVEDSSSDAESESE